MVQLRLRSIAVIKWVVSKSSLKLQLGTLDGTMIAQNNAGPFYPKIDLLVLPYMLQNYDHAVAVADGPIGQEIWGNMAEEIGVPW